MVQKYVRIPGVKIPPTYSLGRPDLFHGGFQGSLFLYRSEKHNHYQFSEDRIWFPGARNFHDSPDEVIKQRCFLPVLFSFMDNNLAAIFVLTLSNNNITIYL